jgi:hypothetical protein
MAARTVRGEPARRAGASGSGLGTGWPRIAGRLSETRVVLRAVRDTAFLFFHRHLADGDTEVLAHAVGKPVDAAKQQGTFLGV